MCPKLAQYNITYKTCMIRLREQLKIIAPAMSKSSLASKWYEMRYIEFYLLILFIFNSSVLSQPAYDGKYGFNNTRENATFRVDIADECNAAIKPPQSFDLEAAKRCDKSWESATFSAHPPEWKLCYPSKTLSYTDFEHFSGKSILRTLQRVGPGSTYKACDGIPRFRFSPNALITTSTSLVTLVHHGWRLGKWTDECSSVYRSTSLSPQCNVPREFCEDVWESYRSRLRTFSETEPFQAAPKKPWHPCGAPGECVLNLQDDVVLLYWPPNLRSRNICISDRVNVRRTVPALTYPAAVTTITEIKFRGKDLYRQAWIGNGLTLNWTDRTVEPSVLRGYWVLTSPDILLAHRPITSTGLGRQDGGGFRPCKLNITTSTIRPAGAITLKSQDI
jgi:hypothetical protein